MAVHRGTPVRTRPKRSHLSAAKAARAKRPKARADYPSLRSWTMARVGSENTAPEVAVRKAAHALGLRFRLHRVDLPGKPDIVFPARRTAMFVHGCFWHQHRCGRARRPKTNTAYWEKKLDRNVERDKSVARILKKSGWRCVVVWECQTKDPVGLDRILRRFFTVPAVTARPRHPP